MKITKLTGDDKKIQRVGLKKYIMFTKKYIYPIDPKSQKMAEQSLIVKKT